MAEPTHLFQETQIPIQPIKDFLTQRHSWFQKEQPKCKKCGVPLLWDQKAIYEDNLYSNHLLIFFCECHEQYVSRSGSPCNLIPFKYLDFKWKTQDLLNTYNILQDDATLNILLPVVKIWFDRTQPRCKHCSAPISWERKVIVEDRLIFKCNCGAEFSFPLLYVYNKLCFRKLIKRDGIKLELYDRIAQ